MLRMFLLLVAFASSAMAKKIEFLLSFDFFYDELISSCMCKGTQQFVHRPCLDHWRSVKVIGAMGGSYVMDKDGAFRKSFSDGWDRILSKQPIPFYCCIDFLGSYCIAPLSTATTHAWLDARIAVMGGVSWIASLHLWKHALHWWWFFCCYFLPFWG